MGKRQRESGQTFPGSLAVRTRQFGAADRLKCSYAFKTFTPRSRGVKVLKRITQPAAKRLPTTHAPLTSTLRRAAEPPHPPRYRQWEGRRNSKKMPPEKSGRRGAAGVTRGLLRRHSPARVPVSGSYGSGNAGSGPCPRCAQRLPAPRRPSRCCDLRYKDRPPSA